MEINTKVIPGYHSDEKVEIAVIGNFPRGQKKIFIEIKNTGEVTIHAPGIVNVVYPFRLTAEGYFTRDELSKDKVEFTVELNGMEEGPEVNLYVPSLMQRPGTLLLAPYEGVMRLEARNGSGDWTQKFVYEKTVKEMTLKR